MGNTWTTSMKAFPKQKPQTFRTFQFSNATFLIWSVMALMKKELIICSLAGTAFNRPYINILKLTLFFRIFSFNPVLNPCTILYLPFGSFFDSNVLRNSETGILQLLVFWNTIIFRLSFLYNWNAIMKSLHDWNTIIMTYPFNKRPHIAPTRFCWEEK